VEVCCRGCTAYSTMLVNYLPTRLNSRRCLLVSRLAGCLVGWSTGPCLSATQPARWSRLVRTSGSPPPSRSLGKAAASPVPLQLQLQ